MAARIFKKPVKFLTLARNFSNKHLVVNVNDNTGNALLSFNSPPVNSLTSDMLNELQGILTELEKQKINGVIITSSKEGTFSGGIDLSELETTDKRRLKKFWGTFRDTFIKLYTTPLLTVAAINGHAPAGGCILSIACDFRVMTKNYKIGGNEAPIGLVPPVWFMERAKDLIGHRQAEMAFMLGKLLPTEEADKIGLIDYTVENSSEGISKAEEIIGSYAKVPIKARQITKKYAREPFLTRMINDADEDFELFINHVSSGDTQKILGEIRLKMKSKSK